MKVILLKDVDSLGQAGEIVQVADGFARNALIPQHNALIATDVNVAHYESRRRLHDAAADREQRGAAELAQTLEKTSITAQVKVGEGDRLFGSVTAQNIADLLKENGYDADAIKALIEAGAAAGAEQGVADAEMAFLRGIHQRGCAFGGLGVNDDASVL